jgi:hypothetical protein
MYEIFLKEIAGDLGSLGLLGGLLGLLGGLLVRVSRFVKRLASLPGNLLQVVDNDLVLAADRNARISLVHRRSLQQDAASLVEVSSILAATSGLLDSNVHSASASNLRLSANTRCNLLRRSGRGAGDKATPKIGLPLGSAGVRNAYSRKTSFSIHFIFLY